MPHLDAEFAGSLRPDFEESRRSRGDKRTKERIVAHYVLERQLAERLLASAAPDRKKLYQALYTELFRELPDHPQNAKRRAQNGRLLELRSLRFLLNRNRTFLEIGCGDAQLSFLAAPLVCGVYAVDVTSELVDFSAKPENVRFLLTDGVHFDIPSSSVDVAYSNQLLEHLHPEDAHVQLQEVARVLKPGGIYRITTPSRITGPHDISVYVDWEARGFHLKEYDAATLIDMLHGAGFRQVWFRISARGKETTLPTQILLGLEKLLDGLSSPLRARLGRLRLVQIMTGLVVHARR